jgi:phosphonopyruvate decarboxylase
MKHFNGESMVEVRIEEFHKEICKSEGNLLLRELVEDGYNFFTGIPCSYLKSFLEELECQKDVIHIKPFNESQAVGIATGAYLAGYKPVVYCQNSAIGYIINPITSLLIPNKIDVLFIISERKDPPYEHKIMGEKGRDIMKLIGWEKVIWVV